MLYFITVGCLITMFSMVWLSTLAKFRRYREEIGHVKDVKASEVSGNENASHYWIKARSGGRIYTLRFTAQQLVDAETAASNNIRDNPFSRLK